MKPLLLLLPLTLFSDTALTTQIAKKLAMLESEIHRPIGDLHIPYDPFHPISRSRPHAKAPHTTSRKRAHHSVSLELSMIFDKKAFINGKWVKENQKIADYVVTKISEDTVFLKKGRKIIKLSLSQNNGILIVKEE